MQDLQTQLIFPVFFKFMLSVSLRDFHFLCLMEINQLHQKAFKITVKNVLFMSRQMGSIQILTLKSF